MQEGAEIFPKGLHSEQRRLLVPTPEALRLQDHLLHQLSRLHHNTCQRNPLINPLTPRRTQVSPFTEISILFQEGIIKKISYERRAYESVDEKSLS